MNRDSNYISRYNEILDEYELESISDNCSIEELEDSIILLDNKMWSLKKDFLGRDSYDRVSKHINDEKEELSMILPILFSTIDKKYFLLKDNESFKNNSWLNALKCNKMLLLEKEFVTYDFYKYNRKKAEFYGLDLMVNVNELLEYGICLASSTGNVVEKYSKEIKYIYYKKNEKEFKKFIDNYDSNMKEWISTCELFFEPIIDAFEKAINGFRGDILSYKKATGGFGYQYDVWYDYVCRHINLSTYVENLKVRFFPGKWIIDVVIYYGNLICNFQLEWDKVWIVKNSSISNCKFGSCSDYDSYDEESLYVSYANFKSIEFKSYDNAIIKKDVVNDFISSTHSKESLIKGEIIRDYFKKNIKYDYLINDYVEKKINKYIEKEREEYWNNNKEEYNKLSNELKTLQNENEKLHFRMIDLRDYLSNTEHLIQSNPEIGEMDEKINDLCEELRNIGILKYSKKRKIKSDISYLKKSKKTLIKSTKEIMEKELADDDILYTENDKKINTIIDKLSIDVVNNKNSN